MTNITKTMRNHNNLRKIIIRYAANLKKKKKYCVNSMLIYIKVLKLWSNLIKIKWTNKDIRRNSQEMENKTKQQL